ncbi:FHA domain-containing protein [Angustibacter sp. McL0619]|uniref:FHA domain-containing protein n=1 Tax=Angustibacter sp. McL0619 TaxID=3415676 RepID=UPI003CE9FC82
MTDEQERPDQAPASVGQGGDDPSATTMHLSAIGATEVNEPQSTDDGPVAIDPGTLAALRAGTALLRVDRGPNAGARFLLDGDSTTVGRHPSSDIFLDDVTVSRRHAEFLREGATFSVRDVGSLNGTYVNGQRIDSSPLATGDEVQVGKFRLIVMLGEGV